MTPTEIKALEDKAMHSLRAIDSVMSEAVGQLYESAYAKAYSKGRTDGIVIGKSMTSRLWFVFGMSMAGLGGLFWLGTLIEILSNFK